MMTIAKTFFADNERGYDGTRSPVHIEDVDHSTGPAVILGSLRQDGHIITADGRGMLVVESAPAADGSG